MAWTSPTTRSTGYIVTSTDWNGVQNNFALVDRVYYKKTTGKAVNSTTGATDLLNGEIVMAAADMTNQSIVRLTAWGNWKQNSGANRDLPVFQAFLGGTKIFDIPNTGAAYALDASTRLGWRIAVEIQNTGASNTQQASMHGTLAYIPTAFADSVASLTLGNGSIAWMKLGGTYGKAIWDGGSVSGIDFTGVDTTVNCQLELKVANANNSANYETKLLGALVELL